MGNVDLEKFRSIRFGGATRGRSRITALVDDESGRTTGFEVDHGDSQEAVVRPQTIEVHTSMSTGKAVVDG